MMVTVMYDVIVIGAGVEGSATAYYLASRYTKNVLLLEQFDNADGARGCSSGATRVTRKSYYESFYTVMMEDAYRMWSEIEDKSGKKLYTKTGMLVFGDDTINPYITSMKDNGAPHKVMTGDQASSLYPEQLHIPSERICVMDEEAGILNAKDALLALQSLFISNGGRFLDNHRVSSIVPGEIVKVVTDKGTYECGRVIVTAGPWSNVLLATTNLQLPLTPLRVEVLYWSIDSDEKLFSSDVFPVTYTNNINKEEFYSIPVHEYPGLTKIVAHFGTQFDPTDDANDKDSSLLSVELVSNFIAKYFKGVNSVAPVTSDLCMYTMTPDKNPYLDKHPSYSNITIGAGFSGHGFKLAPVVGQILSELALDKPLSYDLTPFKINRNHNAN